MMLPMFVWISEWRILPLWSVSMCRCVVIRALRSQQVDLQKRVHEDMQAHFFAGLPE